MSSAAAVLFVTCAAFLAYVYAGYPILLRAIVAIRGARPVRRADVTPSLSLVISAYNEADVIRAKLENALQLDYPAGALDVVVVSDASTDETDAIVTEFADRGVRLVRQPERRGKTAGLNRVVPSLHSELVVFSDANAMYEPAALRRLARNFADPAVGCVTGEARYLLTGAAAADVGERAYWNYEIQIKRFETALGSMVGGDGAIYAIRRVLWRELPPDAINDFLNPLQIVAAGWRAVYEPEAICHEETAGRVIREYQRRVRIVSRSWRAVFQAPGVLNPFRVGLFAWSVISHKLLRWVSGMAALAAVGALAVLAAPLVGERPFLSLLAVGGMLTAALAPVGRRMLSMGSYFAVLSAASLVGVVRGATGRVSGVWTTPREGTTPRQGPAVRPAVMAVTLAAVVAIVALRSVATRDDALVLMFWGSMALLAYVYVGYPALVAALRQIGRRPVRTAPVEPGVCLFITANDEADVIEAKLLNAFALDYPADRLDVVVASDGSVDATNEIVRRFAPRVRLLELSPRRGKIATINEGMRSVTSELVVFSDANTFLEAGALRALVRNFADPQVGAVSGDVALVGERAAFAQSEDLYYRYERFLQQAESDIGSTIGADGALYAIRRDLFVPPPPDTILDDMAIPMGVIRAGRRVVFEGAARAREHGSDTIREEFARKARVIAGAVQFMARHDSAVPLGSPQIVLALLSHKVLRWFSPVFAAGAFGASAALAPASGAYAAAFMAQAMLLGFGVVGCVPALRRWGPVSLAHYFCLVQAAAAVGLLRGVCGRQSVLWRRFARMPIAQAYQVPR